MASPSPQYTDPQSGDEGEDQEPAPPSSAEPAPQPSSSQVTVVADETFIGLQSRAKPAATTSSPATKPKRQLTLDGMFGGGGGSGSSSSKKARIAGPPGSSPSAGGLTRLSGIPFDRVKWASALDPAARELLALELNPTWGLGHTYFKVLHAELTKPYFLDLKRFLSSEGVAGDGSDESAGRKCYPPMKDIYTWSRRTPLDKVRVVIIGQDPYHGLGQAHGLCFSVRPGVAIPASLRNIYAELSNEYGPDFAQPTHGSLLSWASSGVLLLNTSLTVRPSQAGSHANKGWEQFTDAVVKAVDNYAGRGVVFLCWGAWAAKRVAGLPKASLAKHLVLRSPHPSPLSAHRGFLGNNHFKQANTWLQGKYGAEGCIDWCTLEPNGPPSRDA